MKEIQIQEQVKLGFSRTLAMTIKGVGHRLGRSTVTILVIVVAIAFLMNTLSESLLKKSLGRRLDQRIAELRETVNMTAHLSEPATGLALLRRVATADPTDASYAELQNFGGLDRPSMASVTEQTERAAQFFNWLEGLNYGQYRRLLHDAAGLEAVSRLSEPTHLQRFESGLRSMPSLRLPISPEQFTQFLQQWEVTNGQLERIHSGWQQATDHLASQRGDLSMLEALTKADSVFGETIRQSGFSLELEAGARIAKQAQRMLEMRQVERSMAHDGICKAIAQRLNILPGEVDSNVLWRILADRKSALWYMQKMSEAGFSSDDLTTDKLAFLSGIHFETRAIASATWIQDSAESRVLGQQLLWLIIASLVVCMVGITNAMLMSVTQRFREIATMKCLGAVDAYIALTFILEACILGLAGGFLGALVGLVIGIGRMFGTFGVLLLGSIPILALLQATGAALALGVLLAAIATLLPALKAAKLAPMEAMRVE